MPVKGAERCKEEGRWSAEVLRGTAVHRSAQLCKYRNGRPGKLLNINVNHGWLGY
jgi:hypothetical protein